MIPILLSFLVGSLSQQTLFLTVDEVNIQNLDEFLGQSSAQDYKINDPTNTFSIQQILTQTGSKKDFIYVPENIVKSKSYQNKKDFSSLGVYAILDKNTGGYDIYYSDVSLSSTPELKNKVHVLDLDPKQNCYDFVFISKDQFAVSCTDFDDINNLYSLIIITTDKNQAKLNYQFSTTKQYTYADSTFIDYDEKYLYYGVHSKNSADQTYDKDSVIYVLELVKIDQIIKTNLDITSDLVKGIAQQDFSLTNIIVSKDIITFSSYNAVFQQQIIYKFKLVNKAWQKYNSGYETLIYTNYKGYQIGYRFDYKTSTNSFALIGVYQSMVQIFQEGQRQVIINANQIFLAPIIKLTSRYLVILDNKRIYTVDLKTQRSYVKFVDLTADSPLTIETDYYRSLLIIFYPLSTNLYQVDQQLLIARPLKATTTEQQLTINYNGNQKTINYNIYDKTDNKIYVGKGLIQNSVYLQFNVKKISYTIDPTQLSGVDISLSTTVLDEIEAITYDYQNYEVYYLQSALKNRKDFMVSSQNTFLISQQKSLLLESSICQFVYNGQDQLFDCFEYNNIKFVNKSQSKQIKIVPNQQYTLQNANFLLINDKIEIYLNGANTGIIDVGQSIISDYLFRNQFIILMGENQIQIYDQSAILFLTINQASLTLQGYTEQFKPISIFANSNFNGYLIIHNSDDILIGEISTDFTLIQSIKIPIKYTALKISISKLIVVYLFDENKNLIIYNIVQQLGSFQLVNGFRYDYVFNPASYAMNYQNGEVGILVQKKSNQYIACFRPFQQSRDYLGKFIPVPKEIDFIQMGFLSDNSIILYQYKDKSYLIKRLSRQSEIQLTINKPLNKFTQKVDVQYLFSNDYSNVTSKQPAVVEYDFFLYTNKSEIMQDIRIKSTTKIHIPYNAYSSDFYMSQNSQSQRVAFVRPIKFVDSQLLEDQMLKCIPNNGNLICASSTKIYQISNKGDAINSLEITNKVKIIVGRDDDKYIIIYDEVETLILIQTTKTTIKKIGEVTSQETINNFIYFQNYLLLYTSSLNFYKVDIQEAAFTLTDQGVQIPDNIKYLVYQKSQSSLFYTLNNQGIIKQIQVDLNADIIPQDLQGVSYKILDTLNENKIYYPNLILYGLYATDQNIYINTNYGQVIKLKFKSNSFQVQNILIAGKDYNNITYVAETSNLTIIHFAYHFKIYSNFKVYDNIILSIQKEQGELLPLVYETENLTYINYFNGTNDLYLTNTVSDEVYLDCHELEGLRATTYYPGIFNDGDSYYSEYKIQLYRAREINYTPWIIAIVIGLLLAGGFVFYFIKVKSKQIPVENGPLMI